MDPEDRFWDLAEVLLLTRVGVTRSTMMGFPCLRIKGGFFASLSRHQSPTIAYSSPVIQLTDWTGISMLPCSRVGQF